MQTEYILDKMKYKNIALPKKCKQHFVEIQQWQGNKRMLINAHQVDVVIHKKISKSIL